MITNAVSFILNFSFDLHWLHSVSYTHLDVYKRQVLRRYQDAPAPAPSSTAQQGEYVEYPDLIVNLTNYSVIYMGHSDVYKRQVTAQQLLKVRILHTFYVAQKLLVHVFYILL